MANMINWANASAKSSGDALIDPAANADLFRSYRDIAAAAAGATSFSRFVVNFDDLPGQIDAVPNGYHGLDWRNFAYLDPAIAAPGSGYRNGVVSAPHVAFNSGGADAEITSGGGNFNFDSLHLASAWRIGMSVEITAYDDGVLKYDKTVVVSDDASTAILLGFKGVDTILFHSFGGTVDPALGVNAYQFVADDLVFHGGTGAIRGLLFDDVNGDGVRETGESTLVGRTVFIDGNHNGALDAGEQSTITDSKGYYQFGNLPFGAYDVVQVLPLDWRETAPSITRPNYALADTAYNWIEVAGRGTEISFDNIDDAATTTTFANAITFYGQSYTSMNIGTNGLITFGDGDATAFNNAAIPNRASPDGIVAPFWNDLIMAPDSHVYFFEDSLGRSVVEYKNVALVDDATGEQRLTFEVVFRQNGTIAFEYNSMDDAGRSATAGVEDMHGASGTQISYDTPILTDHTGYTFTPGSETVLLPQHVNVDSGKVTNGVNFGSHDTAGATGTIEGTIFHDLRVDGTYTGSDVLQSGFRVFLDTNSNGIRDFGEQATYTDANGHYAFHTLDPGSYTVVADAPYTFQHWQFEGGASDAAATQAAKAGAPLGITGMQSLAAETYAGLEAAGHSYQKGDFTAAHVDGQLIVRMAPGQGLNADGTPTAATQALMNSVGATLVDSTKALGIQLWSVHGGMSLQDAANQLIASGKVLYANPNYTVHVDSVGTATPVDLAHATAGADTGHGTVHSDVAPNDPGYSLQYGYDQIHAPAVWDYSTGSSSVVVADIDTGMDLDHPDLRGNLYTNTGEIAGDGIDNDGNGYVDDVHGWDFVNGDNNPDDDNGHGTHTAGTIGASGNNGQGVTGVNWDVSLMPLKFLSASGNGSDFDAIKAIEYATMMGVKVTNNSWGGTGFDNGLYDAIAAAGQAGDLFIAAAGNSGQDNDTINEGPAGYGLSNIVSVAAVDDQGKLAGFSEYGAQSVDLAAPGVDILSTLPGGYGYESGTSMATPHVAGAIALLLSIDPTLTGAELKDLIMGSVQQNGYLFGKTVSGGELDLLGAINALTHSSQTVTVTAGGTSEGDFAVTGATSNGNDTVQGSRGNDTINGYQGVDTLRGGDGDDLLVGASGNDHLTGGRGADRFLFNDLSGQDGITDFSRAEGDKMLINSKIVSSFGDLTITNDGSGGSYVSWGTSRIDVRNVAPAQLSAADFHFGGSVHATDMMFASADAVSSGPLHAFAHDLIVAPLHMPHDFSAWHLHLV